MTLQRRESRPGVMVELICWSGCSNGMMICCTTSRGNETDPVHVVLLTSKCSGGVVDNAIQQRRERSHGMVGWAQPVLVPKGI